jgi:hypothetical protein
MSEQDETFDSADVFDDEALINQLAAGECLDEDAIGARLSAWREELELATPPILASAATVPEPARRRLPRSFVSTATALVVVAGGSVAAAAATGPGGPLGPLHRMLFGGSSADAPSVPDPTTGPVDSPTQSAIDVEPTAAPSVAISRIAAPTQRRTSTTGDGGDGSNGGSDGGSGDGSNDGWQRRPLIVDADAEQHAQRRRRHRLERRGRRNRDEWRRPNCPDRDRR